MVDVTRAKVIPTNASHAAGGGNAVRAIKEEENATDESQMKRGEKRGKETHKKICRTRLSVLSLSLCGDASE